MEPCSSFLVLYLFTPVLLRFTLSPALSFLHGKIIQYLVPDLLLLPGSWRLHAQPTHLLETRWPGVRVFPLKLARAQPGRRTLCKSARCALHLHCVRSASLRVLYNVQRRWDTECTEPKVLLSPVVRMALLIE